MIGIFRAGKSEERAANIKRENKLYSYAEQMAELELKKVPGLLMGFFGFELLVWSLTCSLKSNFIRNSCKCWQKSLTM